MTQPTPTIVHIIECNQCGARAMTQEGKTVHETLVCKCCTEDHDHAEAANACPGAYGVGHNGTPCGVGVEGCTVCRPVTIFANAATVLTSQN